MGATGIGFNEIINRLQRARDEAVGETKKVVGKGCSNIKKQAQATIRSASTRGYLPHYPRSIRYEVTARGFVITGELGPDNIRPQGGLGRLLEFGSVNNAPIPHLSPALDAEAPKFQRHMQEMANRLLEGQSGIDGPVTDVT
jgi:hypothetical protein